MTHSNPSLTKPSLNPSKGVRIALYLTAFFAFLGFVDSAYLTADHYIGLPLPCSLTDGCETVLASQYSAIGPVPVALLGVGYYLLALFLAVYIYASDKPARRAARGISFLSGLGVLASGYFFYLQVAVIEALCVYCLVSAATSVLLFASSLLLLWQISRHEVADGAPGSVLDL